VTANGLPFAEKLPVAFFVERRAQEGFLQNACRHERELLAATYRGNLAESSKIIWALKEWIALREEAEQSDTRCPNIDCYCLMRISH
jgi:hypothetical protein